MPPVASGLVGGELFLFKHSTIDGSAAYYSYHVIARGPWHFRDFRNIFLPNIGEEKMF